MLGDSVKSIREQVGGKFQTPDAQILQTCIDNLATNEKAMEYLTMDRGLTPDTIKHFQLGYSVERNAIAIPLFKRGKLINIKYRLLAKKGGYEVEMKSEPWIYNEAGLAKGLEKGSIIIVEGEFDLMSVWQSGSINVISPATQEDAFGSWIEYLDSIKKIYIAYDNDDKGKEASLKLAERLGVEKCLEIIFEEKDANEFFIRKTREEFVGLAKVARPYYSHQYKGLGDVINSLQDDTSEKLRSRLLPYLKLKENAVITLSADTNVGKCHSKNTPIMMSDGSSKMVQDIVVGDLLMGIDSKPRKVLALGRGREEMFNVWERGEFYGVNESHILSLRRINHGKLDYHEISVKGFNEMPPEKQRFYRGWKVGVNFPEQEIPLDPYILGVWLGDGTSAKPQITTADESIEKSIMDYAYKQILHVEKVALPNNKAYSLNISGLSNGNTLLNNLRELSVFNNKHIPDVYLRNSQEVRLQLLAGLLDTDGYLAITERSISYEITQKSDALADGIVYLARSLGYRATMTKCIKTIKEIGFSGEYNRISIVGDLGRIPVRIPYKKSNFTPKKNWLTSKIEIEPIGIGDYYGFTLDGDGLYLLGSFTVTHNTTFCMNLVDEMSLRGIPCLVLPFEDGIEGTGQRFLQAKFDLGEDDISMQSKEQWQKMIDKCIDLPVYFAHPKKEDTLDTIIKSKRYFDTKIVILDHIGYMLQKSNNLQAEIGDTVKALRTVANKYNIIIVIVAHIRKLNNNGGWKQKKEPDMDDLKDSSSLKQDVPIVIMLTKTEEGYLKVNPLKAKGKSAIGYYKYNCDSGRIGQQLDDTFGFNEK